MKLRVSVPIEATREEIWTVITDIEHSNQTIHDIDKVEVIEKPEASLNGLKWRETRKLFGEDDVETYSVVASEENHFFKTHSEKDGMTYDSTMIIESEGDHNLLKINYERHPTTFTSRIKNAVFGSLMKTSEEQHLLEELKDIKHAVEHH